jgi:hypothetical protein
MHRGTKAESIDRGRPGVHAFAMSPFQPSLVDDTRKEALVPTTSSTRRYSIAVCAVAFSFTLGADAADEEVDSASSSLLRSVRSVRLAVAHCDVLLSASDPEYQIVETMPLGAVIPGGSTYFVDSAAGRWRTITSVEGIGQTDVIASGETMVQAVNSITGVGTIGEIPAGVHPTSTMMIPNPLLLCVMHLMPLSEDNAHTLATWRELDTVEIPAGIVWSPSEPAAAGLPSDTSAAVLTADFPGGSLGGAAMTYQVWRLDGTERPVRTLLLGPGAAIVSRIDFEYDSALAEWPRRIEVTEFAGGVQAAWYVVEITSLSINDPSAIPESVWVQDFTECRAVFDFDNGSIQEGEHEP